MLRFVPLKIRLGLFTLFMLIGSAIAAAVATAGWEGRGSTAPGTVNTSGGGGTGAGGKIPYWELENTDNEMAPLGDLLETKTVNGKQVPKYNGQSSGNTSIRKRFLDRCSISSSGNRGSRSVSGANCPVIWSRKTGADFSAFSLGEVHYNDPLNEWLPNTVDINNGLVSAFQVKVWRYDGRTGQEKPIFERRVGVTPSDQTDVGRDNKSNQFAYYMGIPQAEDVYSGSVGASGIGGVGWKCSDNSGVGGTWGNGACTKAGALTKPAKGYNYDKRLCAENNRSAKNGERKDEDGQIISDTTTMKIGENVVWTTGESKAPVRPKGVKSTTAYWRSQNGQNYDGNIRGTCYWEGEEIGQGYWKGQNPYGADKTGSDKDQFGKAGIDGKGLKEAIRLDWNVPLTGSEPEFEYAVIGPPNVWYAIQVVATDQREQVVPFSDEGNAYVDAASGGNYFRVFQAGTNTPECVIVPNDCPDANPCVLPGSPAPVIPPDNCGGPPGTVDNTQEPKLKTNIYSNETAVVRSDTKQAILAESVSPLTNKQAIFPRMITLDHFTPQEQYNGSQTGSLLQVNVDTGKNGFVRYPGYSMNVENRNVDVPSNWVKTPDSDTGGVYGRLGMSQRSLPAPVLRPRSDMIPAGLPLTSKPYTLGTYTTEWLHPTLSNPCTTTSKAQIGSWPKNRRVCNTSGDSGQPQNVNLMRNAWDDYFAAETKWEARWSAQVSIPPGENLNRTERVSQLLRCANDTVTATLPIQDSSCQDQWHALRWFGSAQRQVANGYINIANNDDGSESSGAARLVLKTNHPEYVDSGAVWQRGTGEMMGWNPNPKSDDNSAGAASSSDTQSALATKEISSTSNVHDGKFTNTRTFQPEMNFCRQGLQPNSYIYQSSDADNDDATTAQHLGSPDCRGFDVKWNWSSNESDCDVSAKPISLAGTPASNLAKTPAATTFEAPTAVLRDPNSRSLDTNGISLAASWGIYGREYGNYRNDGSAAYYAGRQGRVETLANGTKHAVTAAESAERADRAGFTSEWERDDEMISYMRASNPGTTDNGLYFSNIVRPPYSAVGARSGEIRPTEGRPGAGHAEQRCTRTVNGVWKTGHWEREWAFTRLGIDNNKAGNCRFEHQFFTDTGTTISDDRPAAAAQTPPVGGGYPGTFDGNDAQFTYCNRDAQASTDFIWLPFASGNPALNETRCGWPAVYPRSLHNDSPSQPNPTNPRLWADYKETICYITTDDPLTAINEAPERRKDIASTTGNEAYYVDYFRGSESTWSKNFYSKDNYAYGYWFLQYKWVWGKTQTEYQNNAPANPYNCYSRAAGDKDSDAGSDGVLQISETQANNEVRYSGELVPTGNELGRTDFVWTHGGSTQADSKETKYNAETNGIRYGNNGAPFSGKEDTTLNGTVWANSQACSVTRTDGRRIEGAWGLDNTTGTPEATPGADGRPSMDDHSWIDPTTGKDTAQYIRWAQPGWGANNTYKRLKPDAYTVQFGFTDQVPTSLLPGNVVQPGSPGSNEMGNYAAKCTGSNPNTPGMSGGQADADAVCWRMVGSFDSLYYTNWQTVSRTNDAHGTNSSNTVVKVYQPRNNR